MQIVAHTIKNKYRKSQILNIVPCTPFSLILLLQVLVKIIKI